MPLDQSFDDAFSILLGMHDTQFYVDESRRDRFARMYRHDRNGNLMPGDSTGSTGQRAGAQPLKTKQVPYPAQIVLRDPESSV